MNDTNLTDHIVAVYANHDQATAAAEELRHSGYQAAHFTVIGPNYQPDDELEEFVPQGDRLKSWGLMGALWGGLAGLALGVLAMVFVGFAGSLVGVLWGAFIGAALGALGGFARETHRVNPTQPDVTKGSHGQAWSELSGLGVPAENAAGYETIINSGSFLVVTHGSPQEAQLAMEILSRTPASRVDFYSSGFTQKLGYR